MGHLYISAAHKSSGKTMIATGLARAFSDQGLDVQTFKKGPDYIDPKWLSAASSKPCFNLDFNTHNDAEIKDLFARHSATSTLSLIEGNKGLHDGVALDGSNANSALAKLLKSPVILIINTVGITRGIAPLLQGYQGFDPDVNIAGVILNMVQGPRHESKLVQAVEHYTDFPVLGAVRRTGNLNVDERHMGLIPYNEHPAASARLETLAEQVTDQIDLERLKSIADAAPALPPCRPIEINTNRPDVRIAVAKDAAFGFYYEDDLEALRQAGARIVYFNALKDVYLPTCDGLYIGGGFPETQMAKLEANKSLRNRIKAALEAGLPAYAECGGLMYLTRSITWHQDRHEMVGLIPADTVMNAKPQGRGYSNLAPNANHPWQDLGTTIPAHEFHYSSLENVASDLIYTYDVKRGHGIDGEHDGIIMYNVMANFTHLRDTNRCPWAKAFVDQVRSLKAARGKAPSPAQIAG